MLSIIEVDLTKADLIAIGEYNTVDRVGDSEVDRAKVSIKAAKPKSQDKSKVKNLIKFFLTKFQVSRPRIDFFTLIAR